MDPLILAASAIAMCAYIWGYRTGRCSGSNPCPKCAFHTNEANAKRLAEEQARVKYQADQAELRHDYEHKGAGFGISSPDKFNCPDPKCSRNVVR